MKKLNLTLLVLVIFLSSCGGIRYQMGQTSNDFFTKNKGRSFETVRQSTEWTVYKWVNNWSYDAPYFFYFHYDALYQVDRGRSPDVIIQNR